MAGTSYIDSKKIAKNTIFLYFRLLFILGINLYLSRVVLEVLGLDNYGIYNVVGGFVMMLMGLSGALATATQRFISIELGKGENGDVQKIFSTTLTVHLILAGIILLIGETAGLWFLNTHLNLPEGRVLAANIVFQFSLLVFVVKVINVPYEGAIIAHEKMSTFAFVGILEVVLKLTIVYSLLIIPYDRLIVYSVLLALVAICTQVIYWWYCNKKIKQCYTKYRWEAEQGKNILSFVGWNLIGSLSAIAKNQGVNVVLNMFFGVLVNAANGIAMQVFYAVTSFVKNILFAMNPQIIKSYAAGDKENMYKLVFMGSRVATILFICLVIPIIIETPFILKIWLVEIPQYTAIFIQLILITAVIDTITIPLVTVMHATGKVRDFQIIVEGTQMLTLPVVYLMFKFCDVAPYMAFMVGVIFAVICMFLRIVVLHRIAQLQVWEFIKSCILRIILVAISAMILPYFVYSVLPVNMWSFCLVVVLSIISTLTSGYYVGLNENERTMIIAKVKTRLHLSV